MLIDYHMHSKYSSDGEMTMEEACIKVLDLGIDEIAFTDHIDLDWPDTDKTFNIDDLNEYLSNIEKLSKRFKDRLIIKKGVEIGLQPHILNENSCIIKSHPFDFVIGSVHIIDKMDPYVGKYYKGKTKEESYKRYYQEMLDLITIYDDFDVLGHIGYIIRYSPYPYVNDDMMEFELVEEILKTIIKKGKGIEINTSGYRNKFCHPLPNFSVIRRYRELGGKIITVGSDAHKTEHLGYELKTAIQGIKECGFEHLATFKQRTHTLVKI